jgi:hypothetical protein
VLGSSTVRSPEIPSSSRVAADPNRWRPGCGCGCCYLEDAPRLLFLSSPTWRNSGRRCAPHGARGTGSGQSVADFFTGAETGRASQEIEYCCSSKKKEKKVRTRLDSTVHSRRVEPADSGSESSQTPTTPPWVRRRRGAPWPRVVSKRVRWPVTRRPGQTAPAPGGRSRAHRLRARAPHRHRLHPLESSFHSRARLRPAPLVLCYKVQPLRVRQGHHRSPLV